MRLQGAGPRERPDAMSAPATTLCAHPGCDLEESEHHAFVALTMPDGCKCSPDDWWSRPIPDVCDVFFARDDDDEGCKGCGHDPDCHPATAETTNETEGPTP